MKKKLKKFPLGNFKNMVFYEVILIIVSFLVALFFLINFIYENNILKNLPQMQYGVTFSSLRTRELGLDVKETYLEVLDQLSIKHLRLPTYWNSIQKTANTFDFSETDFLIDEAAKRDVKIVLVLGVRQPRWPECHLPKWAKKLTVEQRQQKALDFIKEVVKRYQGNTSIKSWQVENEPLLASFGAGCDKPDKNFLKKEVELVKNLDGRNIILTDSGELRSWVTPMSLSDVFGTTLYRRVYNKYLGYLDYPYPPMFYAFKSQIIKNFFAKQNQATIIVELQTEPWLEKNNPKAVPLETQIKAFSVEDMDKNIQYAKKTGFGQTYLWGVEWWYFMKENGYPGYWDYAKGLF